MREFFFFDSSTTTKHGYHTNTSTNRWKTTEHWIGKKKSIHKDDKRVKNRRWAETERKGKQTLRRKMVPCMNSTIVFSWEDMDSFSFVDCGGTSWSGEWTRGTEFLPFPDAAILGGPRDHAFGIERVLPPTTPWRWDDDDSGTLIRQRLAKTTCPPVCLSHVVSNISLTLLGLPAYSTTRQQQTN